MSSTNFTLLLGEEKIIAPKVFVTSCSTFTCMFEDTGNVSNSEPIPITELFSVDEVYQYIELFIVLYVLKVSDEENNDISYLDYMINNREDFITKYTDKNKDPPHCELLFEIYKQIGEDSLSKMLEIDGYFNNLRLRKGIILLILAFIRKGDAEKADKLVELMNDIV